MSAAYRTISVDELEAVFGRIVASSFSSPGELVRYVVGDSTI
jgi:hypothetical protein